LYASKKLDWLKDRSRSGWIPDLGGSLPIYVGSTTETCGYVFDKKFHFYPVGAWRHRPCAQVFPVDAATTTTITSVKANMVAWGLHHLEQFGA